MKLAKPSGQPSPALALLARPLPGQGEGSKKEPLPDQGEVVAELRQQLPRRERVACFITSQYASILITISYRYY
jgi:hypothetical protein